MGPIRNKYVRFFRRSQHPFLNKYGVSTTNFWLFLAIARTEILIFQQNFPSTP